MTGMEPTLGDSNLRKKLKMTGMPNPTLGDSNLRKMDQDDRNGTSYIGRQ